jgi:hypothetical protein
LQTNREDRSLSLGADRFFLFESCTAGGATSAKENPACTPFYFLMENTMKTLLISVTGALSLIVTLSAIAGPNWQLIEQGRKDKTAQQAVRPAQAVQSDQMKSMMKQCADMMNKSP